MRTHALRRWLALRAMLPAAACAPLLCTIATSAVAGPRMGFELMAQHVREETNRSFEPEGFPVSGGATVTFLWRSTSAVDLLAGLGYEERTTAGDESYVSYYGSSLRVQNRWRSVVVPLRARLALGPLVRIEAGPEWRVLLQEQNRSEMIAVPFGPNNHPPDRLRAQREFGPWHEGTTAYDQSSFALAFGLGIHWRWFDGDAGVGLRWCEGLGNQLDTDWPTSRLRAFQLVTSWGR